MRYPKDNCSYAYITFYRALRSSFNTSSANKYFIFLCPQGSRPYFAFYWRPWNESFEPIIFFYDTNISENVGPPNVPACHERVRYCCLACIHLHANMIASKSGVYAQHVSIRDFTGSKVPSSSIIILLCYLLGQATLFKRRWNESTLWFTILSGNGQSPGGPITRRTIYFARHVCPLRVSIVIYEPRIPYLTAPTSK